MVLVTGPTLIFTVMISTALIMPLVAERLRGPDMVLLAGAFLRPHGPCFNERSSAVMLHAHNDVVKTSTLLVGAGGANWSLPGMETPAEILLVLISPRSKSPEGHLAVLSQLARAFRDSGFSQKPSETMSAEAIVCTLKARTRKFLPDGSAGA